MANWLTQYAFYLSLTSKPIEAIKNLRAEQNRAEVASCKTPERRKPTMQTNWVWMIKFVHQVARGNIF